GDFGPSVLAIGNFDGVHAGHRVILRRVAAIARERGLTAAVLTFDPHPARVLAPERAPKLISTIAQRLRRMESEGVEAAMLLAFSHELARLSPEEFARAVLAEKLHARVVIIGEDFRFGYKQGGDLATMRSLGEKLGFEVESAGTISRRGVRISSTAVRKLVEAGQVSKACRMLGEPFALEGAVVKGHGIGSKQTVPTLNLAPENELLPPVGVYVTETRDEGGGRRWKSITNVGYRPTFDGQGLTVETFLLEPFAGETPERIEVSFLRFVREERKFDSPELLRAQIMRDVAVANRVHERRARLMGFTAAKPDSHAASGNPAAGPKPRPTW
ncbi:MAG TPA: bifunctional riboflavin kinase/FAD synthetase, partial [Bryobacteraceae bacterium]|nr:bifunctional riboflavin kinase/FAD synthetase [Bryobacteraceae bacterium]